MIILKSPLNIFYFLVQIADGHLKVSINKILQHLEDWQSGWKHIVIESDFIANQFSDDDHEKGQSQFPDSEWDIGEGGRGDEVVEVVDADFGVVDKEDLVLGGGRKLGGVEGERKLCEKGSVIVPLGRYWYYLVVEQGDR